MAGTMCPLLHQRSSCFCEGGGRWGLLQDQSQPELRVPDDGGVERNFLKILSMPSGWIKGAGRRGCSPAGLFVQPCSTGWLPSPWGGVMLGRACCLPSAGEIQQTPTREPTETLSKTNSERRALGRSVWMGGAGGRGERAPARDGLWLGWLP